MVTIRAKHSPPESAYIALLKLRAAAFTVSIASLLKCFFLFDSKTFAILSMSEFSIPFFSSAEEHWMIACLVGNATGTAKRKTCFKGHTIFF